VTNETSSDAVWRCASASVGRAAPSAVTVLSTSRSTAVSEAPGRGTTVIVNVPALA
jgi:hypothetical protein